MEFSTVPPLPLLQLAFKYVFPVDGPEMTVHAPRK